MANEAEIKHPSPAEIPDKMFLDTKKPAVNRNQVLLPRLSAKETSTPSVGSSVNPITLDDDEDETTNVTPGVLPESLDLKTPTVACAHQEPIPCPSLGTAATFPGTADNPITFDEDENPEEKAVAAMPAATNHGGFVSRDTNGNSGTVMPSTTNDGGSVSITCVPTLSNGIRNPYLTPPRATTTHSASTPKTPIKQPPTHEEWECFDAFRSAFHSGKRAEANRRHALDTQKANAMAVEQIHYRLYSEALAAVKAGGDLPAAPIYVCDVCGNTVMGSAPDQCPVCKARKERFFEVN